MIFVSHFKKSIIVMMLCATLNLSHSIEIGLSTLIVYAACPAIPIAYGVYKCAGYTAGFPCATAPWLKLATKKNTQNTKTFSDDKEEYKGPVVVHFTGCADHFQSHEKALENINTETRQPVIAINYSRIQPSLDGLAKQAAHDLTEELSRQKITPTKITFLGHSTGAAVSDKVATKVEKSLDLKDEDISIISFCSFEKLDKIIKIPRWLFSAIGWDFNPEGRYKTDVIRDKSDTFMEDSHRKPIGEGKLFLVESPTNHHLNWEATSHEEIDGKKKSVTEIIVDIINNGGQPDTQVKEPDDTNDKDQETEAYITRADNERDDETKEISPEDSKKDN
jgi:hypothetical protein